MLFQGTYILLVDEISPDKIKATVSKPASIAVNMRAVHTYHSVPSLAWRLTHRAGGSPLGKPINGLTIFPVGKYICMVVRATDNNRMADGMVFLDLLDRAHLATPIGEKFENEALQEKFMEVLAYIIHHPETHDRIKLALDGKHGVALSS